MGTFERETVKRKPVGTLKLMVTIGLIAFATNSCVRIFSAFPSGLSSAISIAVLVSGVWFVWRLISHNGEAFNYKIIDDLLVIERQLGRTSTSFFSLKLRDVLEIRAYDHTQDRKISKKRRFTVSQLRSSWRVVTFETPEKGKLLFEPSETFIESLKAYIAREKVKS